MKCVDDFTVEATPGGVWLWAFGDRDRRVFIPVDTVPGLAKALLEEIARLDKVVFSDGF